jgi:hypothetical protein
MAGSRLPTGVRVAIAIDLHGPQESGAKPVPLVSAFRPLAGGAVQLSGVSCCRESAAVRAPAPGPRTATGRR